MIDVIARNFLLADIQNAGFDLVDLVFDCFDVSVQLIHADFHVLILAIIEAVADIQSVHLLSQLGLCTVQLTKTFLLGNKLGVQLVCVNTSADLIADSLFEFWILYQLSDDFLDGGVDLFLMPLPTIAAAVSVRVGAMLAGIVLSPMQEVDGISSETLKDLVRAVGNVMNDMKTQHEMLKQSAANEVSDGANKARRCGG